MNGDHSAITTEQNRVESGGAAIDVDQAAALSVQKARVVSGVHLPALDGLRGLAIALVLVTHLFQLAPVSKLDKIVVKVVEAGRHGVDLFFVLSGFLITGILLDTRAKPRYFMNFYGRRTLRIFPLYYCSLALVFIVLPALGIIHRAPSSGPLRTYEWALWTYCSNIVIALRHTWVFDSGAISLDHFWSLAVEEQFYLVWPLVIALLWRRALINLCVVLVLGAALLRSILAMRGVAEISIMVLTPCRLDTLVVGALIAVWVRDGGGIDALAPHARRVLWASLVALPLCFWFHVVNDAASQSISYSLLAFFFGSLLVVTIAAHKDTQISRFFGSRSMRFLGKYSYGIYVIHALAIPTFDKLFGIGLLSKIFGSGYLSALIYLAMSSILSCVAAVISWSLLEQHFLKLKRVFV